MEALEVCTAIEATDVCANIADTDIFPIIGSIWELWIRQHMVVPL